MTYSESSNRQKASEESLRWRSFFSKRMSSSYLKWATSLLSGGGPDVCATITSDVSSPTSGTPLWGGWRLLEGVRKDDGKTEVSVLRFVSSAAGGGASGGGGGNAGAVAAELGAARNAVRRMKTLRHPDCLKYIDSCEVEEKKTGGADTTVLYVVTEKITTLEETLRELQDDENRNQYIAMGLQQVARAVSFLNNDANMVHGNVCMDSIAVAESLDWKLHAFDVLAEFDASESEVPLLPCDFLIPPQYKPMEVTKADWHMVRKCPPWSIDAWGLGCLIYEIFSFAKLNRSEDLRNTGEIPELLLPDYQKLLAGAPRRRLNPAKLLENEYFSGKLQDAILFLENLSLKDSAEKDAFFRKLGRIVDQMPTNVAQRKVLPLLLNAQEYGGSPPSALGPMLQIGKQLSDEDFQSKVLPCITRLFASTDRALRVSLLQSITVLEPYFPAQLVNDQLFTNIAAGFADSTAYLRELTLKSIIPLIPKLNTRNLNSELLKYLAKLQVDPEGVIRANTTICLGKIAPNLSDSARKRVLLNAFTRAMKDQFPPARCASLLAITATLKFYLPAELAMRAIPAVAPSLVDPDAEVRTNAFRCIEAITTKLKENSDELVKASEASKAAAGGTGGDKPGTPPVSDASGIMSWAVASVSSRLGATSVDSKPPGTGESAASAPTTAAQSTSAAGRPQNGSATRNSVPAASPAGRLVKSDSTSRFSADSNGWNDDDDVFCDDGEGQKDGDGWGDDNDNDGWGGEDNDDEEGWGDLDEPIAKEPEAPAPVATPSTAAKTSPARRLVSSSARPLVSSRRPPRGSLVLKSGKDKTGGDQEVDEGR